MDGLSFDNKIMELLYTNTVSSAFLLLNFTTKKPFHDKENQWRFWFGTVCRVELFCPTWFFLFSPHENFLTGVSNKVLLSFLYRINLLARCKCWSLRSILFYIHLGSIQPISNWPCSGVQLTFELTEPHLIPEMLKKIILKKLIQKLLGVMNNVW